MSFGIGDFVVVTEKAFLVYNKCKSASDDYAILARHVLVLAEALRDTRSLLDQETPVPTSKRDSLVAARESCRATLNEVEEFLDKYEPIVRKKGLRYIRIGKFIAKDIEGLKSKLTNSTELLQLSLNAISSLSIVRLQESFNALLREYRAGLRQPSVISDAIFERKSVPEAELFSQISSELEDKDIHPDNIHVNRNFITEWLSVVIANGGLEEQPPDTVSIHQSFPRKQSHASFLTVDIQSIDSLSLEDHSTPTDLVALPKPPIKKSLPTRKPVPNANPTPKHSDGPITVAAPNLSDFDFVYSILAPSLEIDPDSPWDTETVTDRLRHSFQEQDRNHDGFLIFDDVLILCQSIVRRLENDKGLSPDLAARLLDSLPDLAATCASNKSEQMDEQEYTDFMQTVIRSITASRYELALGEIERDRCVSYLGEGELAGLPWRWSSEVANGASPPPVGVLTGEVIARSEWMSPYSFTAMSRYAYVLVDEIREFMNIGWWRASRFGVRVRSAVDSVLDAALLFNLFENGRDKNLVSDLDLAILGIEFGMGKRGASSPLERQGHTLAKLKPALSMGYDLTTDINAFWRYLRSAQDLEIWNNRWMDFRAREIDRARQKWNEVVVENINSVRQFLAISKPESSLSHIIEQHSSQANELADQKCRSIHFEVKLHSIKLLSSFTSQISTSKIDLLITTYNPTVQWRRLGVKPTRGRDFEVELFLPFVSRKYTPPPGFKMCASTRFIIQAQQRGGKQEWPLITIFDSNVWEKPSALRRESSPTLLTVRRSEQAEVTFELNTPSYHNLRARYEALQWNWTDEIHDLFPSMYEVKSLPES